MLNKKLTVNIGPYVLMLGIVPAIAYLCLLALLLSLGFWQLGRAQEKSLYLQMRAHRGVEKTMHFTSDTSDDPVALRYRQIEMTGQYDAAHQFLIDNQIVHGQPGYFVMTPFLPVNSSRAILVNRGWVPLNKNRSIIPDIPLQVIKATILGRINNFPGVGLKLKGAEIPTENWPAVVQVVDREVLAKRLGYSLYRSQVELDQHQPDGFVREWNAETIMPPEKHIVYAIQWFGLAFTLTILLFWTSCKKQVNE